MYQLNLCIFFVVFIMICQLGFTFLLVNVGNNFAGQKEKKEHETGGLLQTTSTCRAYY